MALRKLDINQDGQDEIIVSSWEGNVRFVNKNMINMYLFFTIFIFHPRPISLIKMDRFICFPLMHEFQLLLVDFIQ